MSSIRPVTSRLPSSKDLWEDTNLPLCVVVTPCAIQTPKTPTPSSSSSRSSIALLSSIPKCLHCGAPHPTKNTHFRPVHHSVLLCYLCGKTSSTVLRDQREARLDERLDPNDYDQGLYPYNDEEIIFTIPMFDSPNNDNSTYSAPAMACPPVWWIVLDASQTKRQEYWNAVGSVLETTMQSIPSHVHVGIVAANSTTVSSWDLTTPIPHVCQYPYTSTQVDLCLVPADALHKNCIQAALRAVADAHGSGAVGKETSSSTNSNTSTTSGMALGLTIELILEFMEQASCPGDNPQEDESSSKDHSNPKMRYAGGKILCLLGNPPMEFETKQPLESQPHYFQGGVAGACSSEQDKWDGTLLPAEEPSDMTATNLKNVTAPLDPQDLLEVIGTKCALAALGVDVIVVVPENDNDDDEDGLPVDEDLARLAIRPWYGVPLLRVLSDTSGAPGPVMFGTNNIKGLQEQVLVRTPWQPGMTFGAELRLRISPGFELEDSPVEPLADDPYQLSCLLASGGIMGPAVCVEPGLWVMGSCDPQTSFTIDLQVDKQVKDRFNVDGFGEVALKPVIQTCVAYTCVEEDDDDDGSFHTVRKMKVSSLPMALANDIELFYDAMDPEALAAVLFHKITLNAMQDGFRAAQETGETWLRSLLTCLYQSAEVEQARIEELMDKQGRMAGMDTTFKGSERLLDQEGDLEVEDVLMGKGHEKVAVMALMLYGLLQSDALRPTIGTFRPSMDARCAAITQMSYMPPSTLAKCIAPTLQLWSIQEDESIMESVDLNKKSMQQSLEEMKEGDGVFVLNSPQQILVYRADRVGLSKKLINTNGSSRTAQQLGPKLTAAVEAFANEYGTMPAIHYELGDPTTKEAQGKAARRFDNFLLEDKATVSGMKDFAEWKVEMAVLIQEELEKSGSL